MNKKHMALLHAKGKSKKPIEDTVRRCWSDIVVAAANGHSRATIAEALQNDGHHVGAPSGFNAAIARVAKEQGVVLNDISRGASKPHKENAVEEPLVPDPKAAREQPSADEVHEWPLSTDAGEDAGSTVTTTSPYADDRFQSKF